MLDLPLFIWGALERKRGLLARLGKYEIDKACRSVKRLPNTEVAVPESLVSVSVRDLPEAGPLAVAAAGADQPRESGIRPLCLDSRCGEP
jgi:hypothetical protein